MAGRDSLPHFPAPAKGQPRPPPPTQSQGNNMAYQQQPPYQQQQYQQPAAVPAAYPSPGSPVGGYQVGPPASGYGAPQQGYQQGYGQPGYNPARPVSAAPPAGVDPQLYNLFRAADTNGSGQLSERELSRALVNGDWTPFDPKTIKLMVKMFDVDRSGTIGLDEFVGLWGYLDQWRGLFRKFDRDNSGAIDRGEFANALSAFGYRLSDNFVNLLFTSYDKRGETPEPQLGEEPADPLRRANVVGDGQIGFDMFVQSMVTVKTLTEVFKGLDTDRDGFITIGFEQFLEIILRQR